VVKESVQDVILYNLEREKDKGEGGGGWNHSDPWQLHGSITDVRTPQMRTRHVWVRKAVLQSNLLGRPASAGCRSISMTFPRYEAFPSVSRLRLSLWGIIRNPFWITCESCEHSPASECYEWFYHPMSNLRKLLNVDVTSGLLICQICLVMYVFLLLLCCLFVFHLENDATWWRCVLFLVYFVMDCGLGRCNLSCLPIWLMVLV
jgi:hypothetical protein